MAIIRFLDGKQAGRAVAVDDALIPREGRYWFTKRYPASSSRKARPYLVRAVPRERWACPSISEWTAAMDDGALRAA